MSQIPYADASSFLRVVWIDEETGNVSCETLEREQARQQTFYGRAQSIRTLTGRKKWVALTNNEQGIVLFWDGNMVPLYSDKCTAIHHDLGPISHFVLRKDDEIILSMWYFNPYAQPSVIVDWTYDELDRLADDTLYCLARRLRDETWLGAPPQWREGFKR